MGRALYLIYFVLLFSNCLSHSQFKKLSFLKKFLTCYIPMVKTKLAMQSLKLCQNLKDYVKYLHKKMWVN